MSLVGIGEYGFPKPLVKLKGIKGFFNIFNEYHYSLGNIREIKKT